MGASDIFRPSFGNRPSQIVGRDETISTFLRGLDGEVGTRDRALLLLGQRGMGKTALQLEFCDRALEHGFVPARVTAGSYMLDEIIESVQTRGSEFVREKKTRVKGFNVGAVGVSFGLTFADDVRENFGFRTKLSLLCDRLAEVGKGVLVLVDEVQSSTDEMRLLATTYQHLVGDEKNIAIAIAGLPSAISSVLNDKVLTFLNRARKVDVGLLPLGSVRAYYSRVFSSIHKDVETGVAESAALATRGFPFMLQLVGYYLMEITAQKPSITNDDVREAVSIAKEELVNSVFRTVLQPLSARDIDFLEAMALDEGVSRISDIYTRMGVSEKYVQPYRARLIEAGVIAAPRRGEVEFTVPYLGDYLAGRL